MSELYTVFIILGYESKNDRGDFLNTTEFQLIAENYNEALKKAKKLHNCKNFFLKSAIENFKPEK